MCVCVYINTYLCLCPDFCYPALTDALWGLGELLCVCVYIYMSMMIKKMNAQTV
jgi:hypothetical protein